MNESPAATVALSGHDKPPTASESVMICRRRGLAVAVTEQETAELIRLSEFPRFLPLGFGPHGVRLLPMPANAWAYHALSEMRAAPPTTA